MNMRFVSAMIAVFMGFAVSQANAETITIGAEDSWPPFARADGTGLTNQIVREAFATQGINVEYRVAPYARLLADVESGKLLALFNVTKEPSTANRYLFGEHKLFTATTAYFHHRDRPLEATNFLEVRNGESIGMILGYEYGPHILANKSITPVRVKQQTNLVKMLLNKRVDAVIMFDAIAQEVLQDFDRRDEIERAFDGQHSDIYVAFSKSFPRSAHYVDALDRGLEQLRSQGRLSIILEGKAVP